MGRGGVRGRSISKETGRAFFEVSKKHPLGGIFKQIDEELSSHYSLDDASEASRAGYRKTHVTVRPKGLVVQARDGYHAGS